MHNKPFGNSIDLIKMQLKPGAVFSMKEYKHLDGSTSDIKLVVVVSDIHREHVLCTLTTSKVVKAQHFSNSHDDYLIVGPESSEFKKETVVYAKQVTKISIMEFNRSRCNHIFDLDERTTNRLKEKIIVHPNTKPIHKKRIEGGLSDYN